VRFALLAPRPADGSNVPWLGLFRLLQLPRLGTAGLLGLQRTSMGNTCVYA
jgi:hypothetical protein